MSGNTIPADMQTALNNYKTLYVQYRMSGDQSLATGYQAALTSAQRAITNASAAADANDAFINNFISTYENTSGDLTTLQAKSKDIQKQGPALQNTLAQSQQLHSRTVAVADETSLYVKSAIVFGLLIIAGIVGAA
jgi:hypothetical protein